MFNQLKQIFLDWYELEKGVPYYFTAKDAGSLKQIEKKLKWHFDKNAVINGGSYMIDSFKAVLNSLTPWILKNVSLALINSQFNQIISNGISKTNLNPEIDEITKHNPYAGKADKSAGDSPQQ